MAALVEKSGAKTRPPSTCPDCGSPTERHVGVIAAPGLNGYGRAIRVKRLGAFTACTGCEWCVEDSEFGAV